jgi:anthranilate phosphoribosyltransferase
MSLLELNEILLAGRDLAEAEAGQLIEALFDAETPDAPKGAALALLRAKGATGLELAAMVRTLRRLSNLAAVPQSSSLLDTCGTGGGAPSFNLSTAAAIIAAAAGAKIAKHGNRAVTSKCGSADVLECLGVHLAPSVEQLHRSLDQAGIAFLFAPAHHAAMKHIGEVRRQLGFRTVFNQLGPLANPFGAGRQLLGVYDPAFLVPMAEAAQRLGVEAALIVHGEDGLDEISPVAATSAAWLNNSIVESIRLTPQDFGIEPLPAAALAPAETVAEAAGLVLEAIEDPNSLRCLAVLPNAAAALVLAGRAKSWKQGAEIAKDAVASGAARRTLAKLVESSQAT